MEGGPNRMMEIPYRGKDGCPLFAFAVDPADERPGEEDHPAVILMHGGGPDHHSLSPLAERISELQRVILPDVRGYGRSVCRDPASHTWALYAEDVVALLDHIGARKAIVGGAGLGTTISLRVALAYPQRVHALVLISVEDIEDDAAKEAEIAFMDAFAARVRTEGIEAAWQPILKDLSPVIGAMVRDAIPRSDPSSIAAAAAIGRDRSFRTAEELAPIAVPTLIMPGSDWRHPTALAEQLARILPRGQLAAVAMSSEVETADDFARAFAPVIRDFLVATNRLQ